MMESTAFHLFLQCYKALNPYSIAGRLSRLMVSCSFNVEESGRYSIKTRSRRGLISVKFSVQHTVPGFLNIYIY